jgi:hypothetical protein
MTRTGPSSGIGAHCPEAIGECCRAFLLRAVVRRGGKLSYRSQFCSPPMKTVFAELSEDGYAKHNRPTKVIIGSPCARPRSAFEPLDGVRRGACEAQAIAQNASAFFAIFIWGQGFATGACRWSPCGHGLSLSQQSMPCVFSLPGVLSYGWTDRLRTR